MARKAGLDLTYDRTAVAHLPVTTPQGSDTVEELIDLGRATMDPSRRSLLATTVFSAALSVPAFTLPARAADEPVAPGKRTVRVTYARTLRGMSLQASNLRHGPKALELADSAAEAAPAAGPRLVAFYEVNKHTRRPWSASSIRRILA